MFLFVVICVTISFLILYILYLLYKNKDLEKDNLKLSKQTNELLRENSKLRKEII